MEGFFESGASRPLSEIHDFVTGKSGYDNSSYSAAVVRWVSL